MNDKMLEDEDIISHKSLFRYFLQTDLWWFLLDLSIRMTNVMIHWTCLTLHVLNGQMRANQTGVRSAGRYGNLILSNWKNQDDIENSWMYN